LLEDNGTDQYEDEDMRLPIVLASFAAVIGLAAPAQADADGDSGRAQQRRHHLSKRTVTATKSACLKVVGTALDIWTGILPTLDVIRERYAAS
jgi:hypothetical protein